MTRTRWIIFAVICVAILGGLAFFSTRDRVDVSNIDQNQIYITSTEGEISDHVLGDEDSEVVLIEYGDFECPGCQSLSTPLKQLVENYSGEIAFTFRNFPLTNIHANALATATAAEAAGLQGKFYEMHDLLFQNQASWKDADVQRRTTILKSYAQQLGLDVEKFEADLSSEAVSEKIRRDQAFAKKTGATSTPTLVLNGETLDANLWKDDTIKLEEKLRDAVKASGQKLPKPVNAIKDKE